MAKPTIIDIASGVDKISSDGQSSIAANLPTGIQAGDLLLMALYNAYSPTNLTMTGSGFAKLFDASIGGSFGMEVWWKLATGSEGSTVTVGGFNNSDVVKPVCFLVRGATDDPTVGYDHQFMAQTYGNAATSPAATSATDDSLVLRWLANRPSDNTATASGTPTSHTRIYTSSATWGSQFWAEQDAGAASGAVASAAWSGLGTENWGAGTLVIEPAAAANPTISSVTLSGTSQIGNTLTATVVTDQDPVDSTTYQWEMADDDSGTNGANLSGETSSTLDLTYADAASRLDDPAKDVYVRCTCTATKDSLESDPESSAWQEVTVASGGGGGSVIGSPCIVR